MLTKYAEAVQVLDAWTGSAPDRGTLNRVAHRAVFSYKPRPGYIYVRSRAISSRCNDNFDEFPAAEIKAAYRSFVGKPVFVNHHNSDHRRARGVIIDAALHEDTNPDGTADTWAEVLMEVDAVRFPRLAEEVLKGNIARTSMGTDVAYSVCTACGNKASTPVEYCQHIPRMKGMKIHRTLASGAKEEVLVAERCYGLRFFENSLLVEDPADPTAFVLGVDDGSQKSATLGEIEAEANRVIVQAETLTREAARTPEPTSAPIHGPSALERSRQAVAALETVAHSGDLVGDKGGLHPMMDQYYRQGHKYVMETLASEPREIREALARDFSDQRSRLDHKDPQGKVLDGAIGALTELHSRGASRRLAYGETKAPANVDTMRAENCPVCGDDEGYNGDKCSVCGFMTPPSQFRDPDLSKAKEMDLRQDQADQAGLGDPLLGEDDPALDPNAEQGVPGQEQPGEGDLQCTNCGEVFSAEGDAATDTDAPEAEPEATPDEDQDQDPTDSAGDEADEDDDLDDLADLDDEDLDKAFDEDDDDDDEDDEDDEQEEDPATSDPAVGEGRITAEPAAGDLDSLDIRANMTCPICGMGTLVPTAAQPPGESEAVEVGKTDPTKPLT